MTWLAWLALATAVALVPLPSVGAGRAARLARRGRLAPLAVRPRIRGRRRPSERLIGPLASLTGAAVAGVLGGVALGLAAALVAATVAALVRATLAGRRDARRRRGLLSAVRLLVAELEAGARPDAALAAAAVLTPDHAAAFVAAADAAGPEVADVLLASGAADLEPLAHAWRVGAITGAPLADVLDRVASDLAEHAGQERAVTVALAGPRSSGAMLAVLPVAGIALGAAMGARPLAFLLGTPGGRALCCVGVALDAAGVFWTQGLTRRAQR